MDQIVAPNVRKRLEQAFAAADDLNISPQKQANLFGRSLKRVENFGEFRTKLLSESNRELAERAEFIITIAARLAVLCDTNYALRKRLRRKPLQRFGGRTLLEVMTLGPIEDLSEAAGFLEGIQNF